MAKIKIDVYIRPNTYTNLANWKEENGRKTISQAMDDILYKFFKGDEEVRAGVKKIYESLYKKQMEFKELQNEMEHMRLRYELKIKMLNKENGVLRNENKTKSKSDMVQQVQPVSYSKQQNRKKTSKKFK